MEFLNAVDQVSCRCSRCETKLFDVPNRWTIVTPTYITLSSAVGGLHLRHTTTVAIDKFEWNGANELTGCKLRKLTCTGCGKNVGVDCVEATSQARQYQYFAQSILRLTRTNVRPGDA